LDQVKAFGRRVWDVVGLKDEKGGFIVASYRGGSVSNFVYFSDGVTQEDDGINTR
jgi:hypothetical protein